MSSPAVKNTQTGFTLMELMIAMTIMLIVTGSILALMRDGIKVSNTTYEMTDAQESLRSAQEAINRDLVVAGDGLRGITNVRVRQGFVTNYITTSPVTDPATPGYINLSILTSDNDVAASTAVLSTTPTVNVRSSPALTDRVTIIEQDSTFNSIALPANRINDIGSTIRIAPSDVSKFSIGEIYFIASENGGAFGAITDIIDATTLTPRLVFDTGDPLGLNLGAAGGPLNFISGNRTLPTSLMRMKMIHYFVNSNGLLIRRAFGVVGSAFIDSVIAEHVTDLQFRYVLNLTDANGFKTQPVTQLSIDDQQLAVRDVEVTLSTETVHHVKTENVNGTKQAKRQELTMTTSTSIRNLQFREARQPTEDDPAL